MPSLKDTFSIISEGAKEVVDIGLALVLVFLVVDILFGDITGIVGNVSDLIESFTGEGVVGLIAFIVFLAIYRK